MEVVGHLMCLHRRHTAIGEPKLASCVYPLLTSVWVELSFLPKHMLFSLFTADFSPKKTPNPNTPLFTSLTIWMFSLNWWSEGIKVYMKGSMALRLRKTFNQTIVVLSFDYCLTQRNFLSILSHGVKVTWLMELQKSLNKIIHVKALGGAWSGISNGPILDYFPPPRITTITIIATITIIRSNTQVAYSLSLPLFSLWFFVIFDTHTSWKTSKEKLNCPS